MARKQQRAVGAHQVQAAVEGVAGAPDGEIVGGARVVEFMGEKFRIAEKIGLWPLLRFANAAKSGGRSEDMEGLAAMYSLVKDCIEPGAEFERFERHAEDTKADGDDIFKVVSDVIEVLTARPTGSPGDSSTGRQPTSANSKGSSSSPATASPDDDGLVSVDSLLAR